MTVRGVNQRPAPRRRIGLELDERLLERLDFQAAVSGVARQYLVETAVGGLVSDFEAIDAECGVACPDCGAGTDEDEIGEQATLCCRRCRWSRALPAR